MNKGHVFFAGSLGLALGMAACGSSTTPGTTTDAGNDGTSSGGSGSSSGGGSGSGSSSGGGSGSSSGARDAGPLMMANDCPNCPGTQVCCLSGTSPNIVGTCAANAAACPTGSAAQGCGQATDCPGQTCCVMTPAGGGPSTITCQTTCTGGAPACGGMSMDNVDCPGDGSGTGWACVPIPGTPQAVAGKCIAVDAGTPPVDGGATPDSGTPDTGAADTGVDAGATDTGAPHDAAADGG